MLTAGYGQTGPYAKNPGYDVNIEAEAGLMHITGEADGPPVKVGVASEFSGRVARSRVGRERRAEEQRLTSSALLPSVRSHWYMHAAQERLDN